MTRKAMAFGISVALVFATLLAAPVMVSAHDDHGDVSPPQVPEGAAAQSFLCPPCPPCPGSTLVKHTSHSHWPCEDHWHMEWYQSNQSPWPICQCYCNKRSTVICITWQD